jgi:hypothetical protein
MMKLTILFLVLALVSLACAFEVSPANPSPGEEIVIEGTAAPNEEVRLRSSFQMDLPVAEGKYEYETRVEIPRKPNRFTVTARNVKDLNAGVKMVIWITERFEASGGVATVSQSDVPPRMYSLKMFGEALPGASVVSVKVEAETAVRADSKGRYSLAIDTSGIPAGDYRIEGDGDSKIVRIGSPAAVSNGKAGESAGSNRNRISASYPIDMPSAAEITPEVVRWYAGEIRLDPEDPAQYSEAERNLRNRVKGDYWRVIARGEPMTEVAGNCKDKYCLVRGIDACTECREKDELMITEQEDLPVKVPEKENSTVIAEKEAVAEDRGFIGMVMEWIWGKRPGG